LGKITKSCKHFKRLKGFEPTSHDFVGWPSTLTS
jgi:hypothetical protein